MTNENFIKYLKNRINLYFFLFAVIVTSYFLLFFVYYTYNFNLILFAFAGLSLLLLMYKSLDKLIALKCNLLSALYSYHFNIDEKIPKEDIDWVISRKNR